MINFLNSVFKKLFGSKHERDIKKIIPAVDIINNLEILFLDYEYDDFKKHTAKFEQMIQSELDENYVKNLNEKIIDSFKKLKSKKDSAIEFYIEKYRKIFLENRKDLEKKYDKSKMKLVILNAVSDERLEKLLEGLKKRIEKWLSADITMLETELANNFNLFMSSINPENITDIILPEAFALCREASMRRLGLRHFDVQLMGGMVLHQGKIAEMKTGEGKTLVATLSVYLNSLSNKGVHMVTVNEYLAKRDSIWMGEIYNYLGRTVGLILNEMNHNEKQEAYSRHITFGTNTEFGFDYLRDNMVVSSEQKVQREHNFAIIDEVDSILIDEARTPLIISGAAEDTTEKYYRINKLFPYLTKGERKEENDEVIETGDYWIDEKASAVALTDAGAKKCEKLLNMPDLFSIENMQFVHHINQMLRGHNLFKKEVDYIIKDGEVLIVDEFTGRLMPGRRWSDGLHQAIEAKEGLKVKLESQTLATITLQNYFRMYKKLAGMTGTADTEAQEFWEIYKLDVVIIPPNLTMIRKDYEDKIFRTKKGKYEAITNLIKEEHSKGRPILVGTISIEVSELLSRMLSKINIVHNVLNAKYHEREAEIISCAGQKNSITIATNMAGRGTDIMLGSSIADIGGLLVIGTERHEARRIDNQLRGRSGRQGDPGETVFYVALEDDLMRLFGSDRISGIMEKFGMDDSQEIEHPFISKAIERAQKRVEAHNFDIRKHLIDFDNVMNTQRDIIYKERNKMLSDENLSDFFIEIIYEVIENIVWEYCPEKSHSSDWDIDGLIDKYYKTFSIDLIKLKNTLLDKNSQELLYDYLCDEAKNSFLLKLNDMPPLHKNHIIRMIMLNILDNNWKDHLHNLDYLKEGIHLQGWASKDPVVAYKNQSMKMFTIMIRNVKECIVEYLFKIKMAVQQPVTEIASNYNIAELKHSESQAFSSEQQQSKNSNSGKQISGIQRQTQKQIEIVKIGRNDDCPCGSGKKYKKCCGKNA
ncbi:preprotein translocase subunit SecA [Candidatus Dependentiae bacterium]|nr:preprotein translocase subunit SecA [Candidatus Dependentiae bacterium]